MGTLFNKVIKNENQFSQLLVNLVNDNCKIKNIVQNFLFPSGDIFIDLLETQKRNKNGQPDINFNIKNENRNIIGNAIIEVKTQDSKLTKNQPSGYIDTLLLDQGKHFLFFLIPRFYAYEGEINKEFKKVDKSKKSQIEFKIITWDSLVLELENIKYESDLLKEIIEHIHEKFGFENTKFEQDNIKLMNSTEIPKTILKLNREIGNIEKVMGYKNLAWECKWDEGYGDGYGFWFDKNNKYVWIGYDFKIWSELEITLFMQVNKRVNKRAYEKFDDYCKLKERKSIIYSKDNDIKFMDISDMLEDSENTKAISELISGFVIELSK